MNAVKLLLCCVLVLLNQVNSFAQIMTGDEFEAQFKEAKQLLYDFMPEKALPLLMELHDFQPDNHNIEYLIGACHTDYEPQSGKSIKYLEKAKPFIVDEYDADDPYEKGVSIHLYYFLAVGYAQNGRCSEAEQANEKFHELIGKVGQAYLRDAQFWVDACRKLSENPPPPTTTATDEAPSTSGNEIQDSKIVTQLVEYSTPTPLYGVQVGSFSKYLPSANFEDIKNVEAFIDKSEKVRYVVGNFTFRNQAETLLKVLRESGYSDAFIVDINKERKFTKKIVTVNDISINKPLIHGSVHFRCQIGAFRDTIPEEMAKKYLKISGIKENVQGDMTLLSVGHFETYEEAKAFLQTLRNAEIYDAFVVAYNYNQKVPVKEAINHQSKQVKENNKKKRRK